MHRFVAAVVLGLSAFATSACLQIEQTLTLERDLSGKAGFAMNLDMESLVPIMATMKKSMEGKGTVPTAAELAEARKELLSSQKTEKPDFEQEKKEFENQLPAGVKLLDAQAKEDGLKMAASFLLGFDQVSKLSQIQFPKSGSQPDAMGTNPVDSPFGGLKVVSEGQTILITTPIENPLAGQQEKTSQMPMDAAALGLIQQMFKGVRMSFKITAPFEVAEHNAHRREGTTLIWDYDLNTTKLTPEQMKQGVRVRFRR
ncbi:MAG TPA: hypothetical protein VES67_00905 [Vicinamibacterales bacterium]|nr:hypothetical protein [Vicinamibacterales bacterium]